MLGGLRQGLGDENIPIARFAEHLPQPAQLIVEALAGMGFEEAVEQHQQRPQAADGDPHLVNAFQFVAAKRRGLVGEQLVDQAVCQPAEGLLQGQIGVDGDHPGLVRGRQRAIGQMVAALRFAHGQERQAGLAQVHFTAWSKTNRQPNPNKRRAAATSHEITGR